MSIENWLLLHTNYVRLFFFMAAICMGLISLKLWLLNDGTFRKVLLWYFASCAGFLSIGAFTYHPYHDWYMIAIIPHFLTIFWLCWYMIAKYGIGGRRVTDRIKPKASNFERNSSSA